MNIPNLKNTMTIRTLPKRRKEKRINKEKCMRLVMEDVCSKHSAWSSSDPYGLHLLLGATSRRCNVTLKSPVF
jgi:hypothetical protein